jgi:hypothetical protein
MTFKFILIPHGVNCKSSKSQELILYFLLKKLITDNYFKMDIVSKGPFGFAISKSAILK